MEERRPTLQKKVRDRQKVRSGEGKLLFSRKWLGIEEARKCSGKLANNAMMFVSSKGVMKNGSKFECKRVRRKRVQKHIVCFYCISFLEVHLDFQYTKTEFDRIGCLLYF